MAKKEYAFYPGCSSQLKASAVELPGLGRTRCRKTLDIKLTEIPDWNCCGASIGYAEGGELPRHVAERRATSRWPSSTCPGRTSSPPAPPAGWRRARAAGAPGRQRRT
ncbi:MAG: hypothetical protein MZV65_48600 [Chromatiales bacterium]|nr:hypothetical protein [Chromatiales bacterium]